MRRLCILFLSLSAGLLAGTGYWWVARGPGTVPVKETPMKSVPPLDREQVAQGQSVYQRYCGQCHGERGEGQLNWRQQNPDRTYPAPPHDASGHTWHHADGLLYRIIRDGGKIYESPGFKSAMPGFESYLSPEEIKAVITFLKSLWGQEERAFQAEVSLEDPFP